MINKLLGFLLTKPGLILLAVVLGCTHLGAAKVGYDFANRGLEQAVASALEKQAKSHARALKAAVADERKAIDAEKKSEETVEEFDSLANRSFCPPTDDELRVMEGIRKRTQR